MAPDSGSKKKRPTIIDLSQDDDDDDRPNLFPTSTKKRRKTKSQSNSKVKVEGVKNVVVLDVDGIQDEEVQVVQGGDGIATSTIIAAALQQNKATATGKSNGDDDEVAVVGTKNSVRLPHVSVCMLILCCIAFKGVVRERVGPSNTISLLVLV